MRVIILIISERNIFIVVQHRVSIMLLSITVTGTFGLFLFVAREGARQCWSYMKSSLLPRHC